MLFLCRTCMWTSHVSWAWRSACVTRDTTLPTWSVWRQAAWRGNGKVWQLHWKTGVLCSGCPLSSIKRLRWSVALAVQWNSWCETTLIRNHFLFQGHLFWNPFQACRSWNVSIYSVLLTPCHFMWGVSLICPMPMISCREGSLHNQYSFTGTVFFMQISLTCPKLCYVGSFLDHPALFYAWVSGTHPSLTLCWESLWHTSCCFI